MNLRFDLLIQMRLSIMQRDFEEDVSTGEDEIADEPLVIPPGVSRERPPQPKTSRGLRSKLDEEVEAQHKVWALQPHFKEPHLQLFEEDFHNTKLEAVCPKSEKKCSERKRVKS